MQRKGNKLLIQLCSAILLFFTTSWYALANECYIERNAEGDYHMKISSTQLSLASQMVEVPTEIAEATWDVNIQLRGDAIGCKSLGDSKAVHFLNTADPSLISTYTTTKA